MRAYLSGPMTGLPNLNYPAFAEATRTLRRLGYEVYTPHEWEQRHNEGVFNLRIAFADYCYFICREAEVVITLDGWERSPGATAEVSLARAIRVPVLSLRDAIERVAP